MDTCSQLMCLRCAEAMRLLPQKATGVRVPGGSQAGQQTLRGPQGRLEMANSTCDVETTDPAESAFLGKWNVPLHGSAMAGESHESCGDDGGHKSSGRSVGLHRGRSGRGQIHRSGRHSDMHGARALGVCRGVDGRQRSRDEAHQSSGGATESDSGCANASRSGSIDDTCDLKSNGTMGCDANLTLHATDVNRDLSSTRISCHGSNLALHPTDASCDLKSNGASGHLTMHPTYGTPCKAMMSRGCNHESVSEAHRASLVSDVDGNGDLSHAFVYVSLPNKSCKSSSLRDCGCGHTVETTDGSSSQGSGLPPGFRGRTHTTGRNTGTSSCGVLSGIEQDRQGLIVIVGWGAHSRVLREGGRNILKLAVLELCETLQLKCFEDAANRGRLMIPREALLDFAERSAGHTEGRAMMHRTAFRFVCLTMVAGGGVMLAHDASIQCALHVLVGSC